MSIIQTNIDQRLPVLDSDVNRKSKGSLSRFLVIIVMVMLITSALGIVVNLGSISNDATGKEPVKIKANNGQREVTWTISNMFEMYLPDTNYNRSGGITFEQTGKGTGTMGMPHWYSVREVSYPGTEAVLRDSYPFLFLSSPYAANTPPDAGLGLGYDIWSPERMYIDAKNITDCSTTKGAIFVPDLGPGTAGTGWINMTWYQTYMGEGEVAQLQSNSYTAHFASWLYGLGGKLPKGAMVNDDGYYAELQGKVHYSRTAAMTYLGWNGAGDVRIWFDGVDATLSNAWLDDWNCNGSGGPIVGPNTGITYPGSYDIYTGYEYPEDIRSLQLIVDDANSTANELTLLVWCMSWGMDVQIVRYLEAANITKKGFQSYMEDLYLNVSVGPSMSNISLRGTCDYDLSASEDEDSNVWSGGWGFEPCHMDYTQNIVGDTSYPSPFNAYSPTLTDLTVWTAVPGTTRFGQNCSYYYTPMNNSLVEYEKIVIKMKTTDVLGVEPYVGASDTINAAKIAELKSHLYWGRMVLGPSSDPWDLINESYDQPNKVITLVGPLYMPAAIHSGTPGTIIFGQPSLQFDVRMISSISCWVNGSHDPSSGPDTLTITGLNASGKRPVDFSGKYCWNATVRVVNFDPLSSINATGNNVTWISIGNNSGTITIPMSWGTEGSWKVVVWDRSFSEDNMFDGDEVPAWSGTISVTIFIPEFQDILIPMIGMAAIIFAVGARRRRRDTE